MLETYPQENMNTQAIRELTDEVFRLKQIVNELNGGGGGGNLPEPTIADAGKVLGVDAEGEYALVEAGGANIPNFRIESYIPTGENARLKIANWTELTTLAQVKELFEKPYFISEDWRYSMDNVYYGSRNATQWNVNMIAIAQAVATQLQIAITNMCYYLEDGTKIDLTNSDATRPMIITSRITAIAQGSTPTFTFEEIVFDAITGRQVNVTGVA